MHPDPYAFETALNALAGELDQPSTTWVQITSGEHHFAPRPIEAAQPAHIQHAWKLRRNTIWHLFQRDLPRPHYTGLKAELNALAAALARAIDAAADPQPPTKPGNRHL